MVGRGMMPPEPPNTSLQLSSRFQAAAVVAATVTLAFIFSRWFLPERVVKAVDWFFDALFSAVVVYFVAYWWKWRTIPPFLRQIVRLFPVSTSSKTNEQSKVRHRGS
jgi:ABC-type nickel/cobalt efflux system permease component RcnA